MDDKFRNREKDIVIIISFMMIYVLNRILKSSFDNTIVGTILKGHLNDYICGCVFIAYTNVVVSFTKYQSLFSLERVIGLVLICSISWEVIAPLILPYSTGDLLDILSYLLGAISYWFIIYMGKNDNKGRLK